MRSSFFLIIVVLSLFSCNRQPAQQETTSRKSTDSLFQDFTFQNNPDSIAANGEQISYHKNGVIKMQGIMKDNKREGVWKSWYENGLPWSETTFKNGKKDGPTTTWYESGNKRYEGFFTNDKESGRWIFWKEDGSVGDTKNYDLR
ncbi:MAG TPA: hypothetical protein VLB84_13570 [Bacteroidia bacterium]|nr:hypothetical protein [Bacteroidia bacterium]